MSGFATCCILFDTPMLLQFSMMLMLIDRLEAFHVSSWIVVQGLVYTHLQAVFHLLRLRLKHHFSYCHSCWRKIWNCLDFSTYFLNHWFLREPRKFMHVEHFLLSFLFTSSGLSTEHICVRNLHALTIFYLQTLGIWSASFLWPHPFLLSATIQLELMCQIHSRVLLGLSFSSETLYCDAGSSAWWNYTASLFF